MKLRSGVLGFAFLFLISQFPTFGQASPPINSSAAGSNSSVAHNAQGASISGTIFDPNGRAVEGARVTLLSFEAAVLQLESPGSAEAAGGFRV